MDHIPQASRASCLLGAAAALALLGGAAPSATAPSAAPAAVVAPFETLRLSMQLARTGLRRDDPLLLLAAARLRRSVAVRADDLDADRSAQWIAAAERLGGDDPRIAGLAQDLRVEMLKGRAQGPRVAAAFVRAGEQRSFVERFRPGIPAVVYVEGDGDSDLALSVASASGTACHDTAPGDIKICAWTPRAAGPVKVEVVNVGSVQNRFILGTN